MIGCRVAAYAMPPRRRLPTSRCESASWEVIMSYYAALHNMPPDISCCRDYAEFIRHDVCLRRLAGCLRAAMPFTLRYVICRRVSPRHQPE